MTLYGRRAPSDDGYRPIEQKGGSEKGRRLISWRSHRVGCVAIIAIQKEMEKLTIHERDFGGLGLATKVMKALIAHPGTRKWIMEVPMQAPGQGGRETGLEQASYLLYQRGHKIGYDNKGSREDGTRGGIGSEYYRNDPRLRPHIKPTEKFLEWARKHGYL